jgi:hypothetical protein
VTPLDVSAFFPYELAMQPFVVGVSEIKPAFDALGPYPILQFFAALIVVICFAFGGILLLRGEKFARKEAATPLSAPRTEQAAVQMFFDGPLKAIFDVLHEIQTAQTLAALEQKDVIARALSEQRVAILNQVNQCHAELASDIENDKRDNGAVLREMRDKLVAIDTRLALRK